MLCNKYRHGVQEMSVNFLNCLYFLDPEELKKCIQRIQELVLPLPRPIVVVARYLFAFLNQ